MNRRVGEARLDLGELVLQPSQPLEHGCSG
jgi:hypothetical protein